MTFKQKNIAVSLVNFILIEMYFLMRVTQLVSNDNFDNEHVFRLWGTVIFLAIVVTVLAMILAIIMPVIVESARTGNPAPEIDRVEDERDEIIDLKGTRVTQTVSSLGSLIAMLTFVFGQPALVMFTLLIFFGVLAQIVGDARRLLLYRRGF